MLELILPSEKRLHKEIHVHHCPIHHRAKALGKCSEICYVSESNDVCQKTLRGTNLEHHEFPCLGCSIHWRASYGGETFVGGLIDLEQFARLAHVAPDANVDEREEREAESNNEITDMVEARKRV